MPVLASPSNSLMVSVGVQTHPGRERKDNQDRVTRAATPYGDLFVLADGVGGYQGGEEAAQAVVDGFSSYLNTHGGLELHEALQQATQAVSAELAHRLAVNGAQQGMGSTVILCVVQGTRATYAHAGDSRLYLVRGGELKQLTRDHSMVERMIVHGILTPEQALDHPNASALTQALGLSPDVTLDIAEVDLHPGDALLLCSDGLWGYAAHPQMEAIATAENLSAASVAEALLDLALEGGGGDNISIQFLRFTASLPPEPNSVSRQSRKTTIATVILAVLLVAIAVCAFLWNRQHSVTTQVTVPIAR